MAAFHQQGVNIAVLDKELTIACPEGQAEALRDAATFLDEKMREIKEKGGHNNILNVALMAALNLSHELLSARTQHREDQQQLEQRIKQMQQAIEQSLTEHHS